MELGCDVNAVDNEDGHALHYAAYRGINPIVQFLVEKGAKIDSKDQYGQTPLSIAEGIIPEGMTDRSKAPMAPIRVRPTCFASWVLQHPRVWHRQIGLSSAHGRKPYGG